MLRAIGNATAYVLTGLYVITFLLVFASGIGFLALIAYGVAF